MNRKSTPTPGANCGFPAGLVVSGTSPDGRLVEIIELRDHPWYCASQFHPEFKSRPLEPHPLFSSYLRAVSEYRRRRMADQSATPQKSPARSEGASADPPEA